MPQEQKHNFPLTLEEANLITYALRQFSKNTAFSTLEGEATELLNCLEIDVKKYQAEENRQALEKHSTLSRSEKMEVLSKLSLKMHKEKDPVKYSLLYHEWQAFRKAHGIKQNNIWEAMEQMRMEAIEETFKPKK